MKVIKMRSVSKSQARKEILAYLEKRKEAYGSDISEGLGIDINLVFPTMKDGYVEMRKDTKKINKEWETADTEITD